MNKNMAPWDRLIRAVFAIFLLSWAIAGGPLWAYIGLVVLATAAWGFCPLYWLLKIKA